MRTATDGEELRAIIAAFGRGRAAFADETASFFMDVELTMAQFRALVTIRRFGKQTGRELAGRLHVTPGTLVPLVDRLEDQGYVRRVPDRDDRRITWLELTPKADRLFQRMWSMGAARIGAAISKLVPKDRTELCRLLNRVAEHLETSVEAAKERAAHPSPSTSASPSPSAASPKPSPVSSPSASPPASPLPSPSR